MKISLKTRTLDNRTQKVNDAMEDDADEKTLRGSGSEVSEIIQQERAADMETQALKREKALKEKEKGLSG